MSPALDRSQSSESSQPYHLLAPLVLLSFPTSIVVTPLPPHTGWMSETERRERATDRFVAMSAR